MFTSFSTAVLDLYALHAYMARIS